MTNVYGLAKNIPSILLLLCHLTMDRANSESFPISSQLNKSKVPTFPPPQGQKFCHKFPSKSPFSPTSARGPPLEEADDKCITSHGLRWLNTVFAHAFADVIQCAQENCKQQTRCQQGNNFIYSTPALSVLFFSITECSILMALVNK